MQSTGIEAFVIILSSFDLLSLYELKPGNFTDNQFNIPESGNGIPDILDEAEYGLLVWKKGMTPEGGVPGFVETTAHPTLDDPAYKFAYSLRHVGHLCYLLRQRHSMPIW